MTDLSSVGRYRTPAGVCVFCEELPKGLARPLRTYLIMKRDIDLTTPGPGAESKGAVATVDPGQPAISHAITGASVRVLTRCTAATDPIFVARSTQRPVKYLPGNASDPDATFLAYGIMIQGLQPLPCCQKNHIRNKPESGSANVA